MHTSRIDACVFLDLRRLPARFYFPDRPYKCKIQHQRRAGKESDECRVPSALFYTMVQENTDDQSELSDNKKKVRSFHFFPVCGEMFFLRKYSVDEINSFGQRYLPAFF
jgi:hypothetical protein